MVKIISLVGEENVRHGLPPSVCATNAASTGESVSWPVGKSRYAGVSMHRDQSGTMVEALRVRREWLSLMGYSEEEIIEALEADVPPLDLDEEKTQLEAAKRLRDNPPSYEEFRNLFRKRDVPGVA
jgi:hypothetical protein